MTTTYRAEFGQWLRDRIEERRAGPNAHLARALGMSPSEFCNVLAGRRQLRRARYLRLAKLLGLSQQQTDEGRAMWHRLYRPPGKAGAKVREKALQDLADEVGRLAAEPDMDERMLLSAEIRKKIVNL